VDGGALGATPTLIFSQVDGSSDEESEAMKREGAYEHEYLRFKIENMRGKPTARQH
jgi:hypothetical protein